MTIDTTKSSTHYRNELLVQHNRTMSRSEHEWTFEHSIVCAVDAQFAWNFWTTVSNWALDKDVESIDIDGPFAAGTRGVTHTKSSGRIEWRIVDAGAGTAIIEFPLTSAVGRVFWTFEKETGRTRITQRFTLEGESAQEYVKLVGPVLATSIPEGMQKLCKAIESAARSS